MTSASFDNATLLNKSNLFKMTDNFYQRWLRPLTLRLDQVLLVMHKSALFKPATSWVTASAGRGMYPATAAALWQFYREPETIGLNDVNILYFATENDLERRKYSLRVHSSPCSARTPVQIDRSKDIDVEAMSFEELKETAAALRHEAPRQKVDFEKWKTIFMWTKKRGADGVVSCTRIDASASSHYRSEDCPPV